MTRQQAPEIAVEGDQMLRLVDDGRRQPSVWQVVRGEILVEA